MSDGRGYAFPMEATVTPPKARKPKTRANGEGSVYKLSDGRWRATRTAGFTDGRKQKIIAGSGPTRELAIERREASWRKWLVSTGQAPMEIILKTTVSDKAPITVEQWFYDWHDSFDHSRTKEHYRRQVLSRIELHIAPAMGKTPLTLLTSNEIEEWVRKTMPSKQKANGSQLLTYGTISNIFSTFRLGLDYAVKRGHITSNPALSVEPPKKQQTRKDIGPSADHTPQRLMQHVRDSEDECFYILKVLYGLRISEILGLTMDSFVFKSGGNSRIIIKTQLKRKVVKHGCGLRNKDKSYLCGKKTARSCPQKVGESGLYLDDPKSEAGIRTLPLVEPALSLCLKRWDDVHKMHKSEDFDPLPGLEELFFTSPIGRPIVPTVANNNWHKVLEAAGIPYVRGHDLRHMAASMFAENNVGLEIVKSILGHSTVAQSSAYTHVTMGAAKAPLEALGKVFDHKRRAKEAVEKTS